MFDTDTEAEGDISGLHRFMPSETPFLKAAAAIANGIPQPGNTLWKPKICGASLPTEMEELVDEARNVVIPDLWGKSSDSLWQKPGILKPGRSPRFVGQVFRPNEELHKSIIQRRNPRFVGQVFRRYGIASYTTTTPS